MTQKTIKTVTELKIDPPHNPAAKIFLHGTLQTKAAASIFVRFLYLVSGFVLGLCAMPYGTYPCGTALICACGKYRLFSYIGACVAALLTESTASTVAINTLVFFLFAFPAWRKKKHFADNLRTRIIISAIVGVVCGGAFAYAGGWEHRYLLCGLSFAIFLPSVTLCISCALASMRKNTAVIDGAFCTACVLFTYALSNFGGTGFYPAVSFAALSALVAASCGGSLYGILFGAVCGVACGGFSQGAVLAVCFAAAGGISGLFAKEKMGVSSLSFAICFFACAAYFEPADGFDISLSCGLGCTLFPGISALLPRMAVKSTSFPSVTNTKNLPWEHLSATF